MSRSNFSIPGTTQPSGFERQPNASLTSRSIGSSRPANWVYDPDQWYLDAIEQYSSDPELYKYLMTNPHLLRNSGTYQPYWFEKFIGTSDTNELRYNAQMKSEANSWLADALKEKHIEEYTDPAAEIARRKNAGINDDLTGGSQIGAGEPANPSPEDTDTDLPYNLSSQANEGAINTISSVMSAVNMAMNMASSFQALNAGEISMLNGEISNYSDFNKVLGEALSTNLSADELNAIITDKEGSSEALSKAMNFIMSDTFLSSLPPRLRKRFSRLSRRGRGNDIFTASQLQTILKSYSSERFDLANILGHPFYKKDFNDTIALISDYVSKYQIEYDKLWKDFDFDKLGVLDKETGMTLGEMEGQAQLASKRYEALRADSDAITEKLWNDIETHLKSKNTWWSNLLLFFVPFARSMANNARMPSLGLNASVRNGVHDTRDVYMH